MGATRFEEKPRGVEVQKEARGKVSARKGKICMNQKLLTLGLEATTKV